MLVMVLWQRFWESMRCRVPDLAKICASHDSSRVDEAATQMQALDQPQENTGDLLSKLTSGAHHQSLDALMAPQGSHLGMYDDWQKVCQCLPGTWRLTQSQWSHSLGRLIEPGQRAQPGNRYHEPWEGDFVAGITCWGHS